jgi:hypothetical protein
VTTRQRRSPGQEGGSWRGGRAAVRGGWRSTEMPGRRAGTASRLLGSGRDRLPPRRGLRWGSGSGCPSPVRGTRGSDDRMTMSAGRRGRRRGDESIWRRCCDVDAGVSKALRLCLSRFLIGQNSLGARRHAVRFVARAAQIPAVARGDVRLRAARADDAGRRLPGSRQSGPAPAGRHGTTSWSSSGSKLNRRA